MHEPPVQIDPSSDFRPVWAYMIAIALLWTLPWFGVECLFGWCVVQDEDWWIYAMVPALPVLLFLEFPLRLWDRFRERDKKDC